LGGDFGELGEPAIPASQQAGGGQELRGSWRGWRGY